jgi:hypothetical protein
MTTLLRRDKGSALTWDQLDDWAAPEINQTTHGFAVGDLVYRDSATTWAKAQADAEATLADGIVIHVEDANNCSVVTKDGTQVTITTHGLTVPDAIYLSQSVAGAATSTIPANGLIQQVGKAIDANTIIFRLGATAYEI